MRKTIQKIDSLRIKLRLFASMICIFIIFFSKAQEVDSLQIQDTLKTDKKDEEKKNKKHKKNGIIWLPALAYNPSNGFLFGIAPAVNWKTYNNETTSYSSLLGSVVWTTKSQFLFTLKGNVFFKDNKSILMQDIRYFKTSQPTFGLGTGSPSSTLASNGFEYEDDIFSSKIDEAQLLKFDFLRIYETYFQKIGDNKLYAGIGYHLDINSKIKDNLLDLDTIPPTITSHYAYSTKHGFNPEKYTLSGVSANLMYDERDNPVNPYKGRYGLLTVKYNPKWLGSSESSGSLWAEFREYFNIKKNRPRNLLALWAYGSFELGGGSLPYMDLPALGWDQYGRSGRAYAQGRFRGQSLLYTEVEWRFPLQKKKDRFGGVLFFNATTASNKDAQIGLYDYINTGFGAGIRFMIKEQSRTNLCIDYGIGNYGANGFYFGINEVF